MFEAIGAWLVQLVYGWRIEAIHWLSIYGAFVLVCCIIALVGCIIAAIVFGLHLVWRSLPGRWPILILGILGLIVWGALGNPTQIIAGWIWPRSPARWEGVDAQSPLTIKRRVALSNVESGLPPGGGLIVHGRRSVSGGS